MNGVVALTVVAPAIVGLAALIAATILAWREPLAFGGLRARLGFVVLWVLIAPLAYAVALVIAETDGPDFWIFAGRLGLIAAIATRLGALPIRRRVHWALGVLAFAVGAIGAVAARFVDPNSGKTGAVLGAAALVPGVLIALTRLCLGEDPRRARVRHELVRWAAVGVLGAVFTLLLPKLGQRRQELAASRPLQAAIARARVDGVLDLSQQKLAALPPELGTLTALVRLDLTGCELRALPDAITQLVALEEISLVRNAFDDLPAELRRLARLPKLRVLRLGDNRLEVLPVEIGQLAGLVELQLQHNRLTALPAELAACKSLRVLQLGSELDGNRLAEMPAVLAQLPELQTLDLRNNPLPPEALAALRKALPRTTILPTP